MRWWWVRHGPTHAKGLVGHLDLPADLSDSLALNRLHDFLPTDAPVISSDLIRASETADKICDSRKRLESLSGLREMDYGKWDGKTFEEISQMDPVKSREFWEKPGDVSPPGGESWNRFNQRISTSIENIEESYPSEDIIVVAHFGVILSALQIATKMPSKSIFSFKINNLSVSCFSYLPQSTAWRVEMVNQSV